MVDMVLRKHLVDRILAAGIHVDVTDTIGDGDDPEMMVTVDMETLITFLE